MFSVDYQMHTILIIITVFCKQNFAKLLLKTSFCFKAATNRKFPVDKTGIFYQSGIFSVFEMIRNCLLPK